MPEERIKLVTEYEINGTVWHVEAVLGRGGFSQVFQVSDGIQTRALKVMNEATAGWRDILVNDIPSGPYALPIVDSAEVDGTIYLLLPLADGSLRDAMPAGQPMPEADAITILLDIAGALEAIDAVGIVHRDIKPENVLRHEGAWKLSDFGESRYADATTSAATRRLNMTPEYAAPERWWDQRATSKADVYSWGVMAFEILTGARPFPGPREDLRDQHLNGSIPDLVDVRPGLAGLVKLCLQKPPEARPSASSLRHRLQSLLTPAGRAGFEALEVADAQIASEIAEATATQSRIDHRAKRMSDLYDSGLRSFEDLAGRVRDLILSNASTAVDMKQVGGFYSRVALRDAELRIEFPKPVDPAVWGETTPVFEVAGTSAITVLTSHTDENNRRGRSHALWYGDIHSKGNFEWFETCFVDVDMENRVPNLRPFSWDLDEGIAWLFLRRSSPFALTRPFQVFSYETVEASAAEWAGWLAAGASGPIESPRFVPEMDPDGSWREVGQDLAMRPPAPRS